jgi:hypothetical protein
LEEQLEDARALQQVSEKTQAILRKTDPAIGRTLDLLIKQAVLQTICGVLKDAIKMKNIQFETLKAQKQRAREISGMQQVIRTRFGPNPKDIPRLPGKMGTTAGLELDEGRGEINGILGLNSRVQPWKGKALVASKALQPPIVFNTVIQRSVSLEAEKRAIQEIKSPDEQVDELLCDCAAMESQLADLSRRVETLSSKRENFGNTLLRDTK